MEPIWGVQQTTNRRGAHLGRTTEAQHAVVVEKMLQQQQY